eukprot:scaffold17975_cov55-Attheya_sp.AAC.1
MDMNGRDEGIDGEYVKSANGDRRVYNNRASHKPHAVIADGAAMQRVPGSLRFLTRSCREADVPFHLSAADLKQQLQDHKVLLMEDEPSTTNLNSSNENQPQQQQPPQIKQCRKELIQLCHECIEAAAREANNNKLWNDSNSNVVVTTTSGMDSQEATTTTVLAS